MNILDKIIAYKYKEVERAKAKVSVKALEESKRFEQPTTSLKAALTSPEKAGIIAEIKRKSPSKGIINPNVSLEKISQGYVRAGVSGMSVLTDTEFFGGSFEDFETVRSLNDCPILRKDFIVDEYQILQAKSMGADVILLIAAVLKHTEIKSLAAFANSLGLEVLMEVHNESELLDNLHENIDMIGVNNRNLKTFEVSIETSIQLAGLIPDNYVKVSESGISQPESIIELKKHGFEGFLIGETFMKTGAPEEACAAVINELYLLEHKK